MDTGEIQSPPGDDKSNKEVKQTNQTTESRIQVSFRPIGNTKRLANPVLNVQPHHQFGVLQQFVTKQLQLPEQQSLFMYINSSFAPSPDVELGDLHQGHAINGVLNVSYCASVAFG